MKMRKEKRKLKNANLPYTKAESASKWTTNGMRTTGRKSRSRRRKTNLNLQI